MTVAAVNSLIDSLSEVTEEEKLLLKENLTQDLARSVGACTSC